MVNLVSIEDIYEVKYRATNMWPPIFFRIILLRRYCIPKKQIMIRHLAVSEKAFGLVWVVIKHRRATLDGNGKMTSPSCSPDGDWINLIWEMWTWNHRNHAFTSIKVTKPNWLKVKVKTTESRRSPNVNAPKSENWTVYFDSFGASKYHPLWYKWPSTFGWLVQCVTVPFHLFGPSTLTLNFP